jgi:hypothetical protein
MATDLAIHGPIEMPFLNPSISNPPAEQAIGQAEAMFANWPIRVPA